MAKAPVVAPVVAKKRGRQPVDMNLSEDQRAKLTAQQKVNSAIKSLRAVGKLRGLSHDAKGDIIAALDSEVGAVKTQLTSQSTVAKLFEFQH